MAALGAIETPALVRKLEKAVEGEEENWDSPLSQMTQATPLVQKSAPAKQLGRQEAVEGTEVRRKLFRATRMSLGDALLRI